MMPMSIILIIALPVAILFDVVILRWLAKKNRSRVASPQDAKIFGVYSPVLTEVKSLSLKIQTFLVNKANVVFHWFRSIDWKQLSGRLIGSDRFWIGVELFIIFLWSISFTIPYLEMDPYVLPIGNEYPSIIQSHHLWTRFLQCGACFMWNGSIQGGNPAFVDPHGSMLHPLVVITTLIAGVQNGAKVALVTTFMIAGLIQWWLAYILGLGRIPRLWSGMMAVVAGHLASRMELGLFSMVLSTTCVSLVVPALIWLAQSGSRRAIVVLGISLASVALSGQGYMQIGLLFIVPVTFLLITWESENIERLIKHLILAGLIGFLVASPFLVPYLHFFPEFAKDLNPEFNGAQPFKYLPLNLVIDDHNFYLTEYLQKLPYPSIYGSYIGWIPVILAVLALFSSRNSGERRASRFLFSIIIIATWVASAMPFKWLVENIHIRPFIDLVAGIRHPSYIFGLAAPAVLGLASIGLDQILKRKWPQLKFDFYPVQSNSLFTIINLRWLMAIPLLFSLVNTRAYNEVWIHTTKEDPVIRKVNQALIPTDLQWVNPPYGVHGYIESAVGLGMKLSNGIRAWFWKDRLLPKPVREASFTGSPLGMIRYAIIKDVGIYRAPPGREYAQVLNSDGTKITVCQAHGTGGNIDVSCHTLSKGTLVVFENSWTGWCAELDGNPAPLQSGQWLSIDLPVGRHQISFRYRPWDVPLGIALSLLGLVISILLWVKKEPPLLRNDSNNTEPHSLEMSQKQDEI